MASNFVGVIRSPSNNRLYAVIKPSSDVELDNPNWLKMGIDGNPVIELVKVPRAAYDALTAWDQLADLVLLHA